MSFLTAHPRLQSALTRRGYTEPTTVQAAVLAAEDQDLLVSAQTGSGKTVAFGMLLAKPLLGDSPRFPVAASFSKEAGAPLALIVTPTRELAQQVHRELAWLYADTGARITTCVGGMDPRRERHDLDRGVHIVVGTPGRLCDHLERGSLVLSKLHAVVLDEADEMLDMGFREDIERLLDATPATRRTLMFSATIPKEIATLAKRYQKTAVRIASSAETDRHHDIEYQAMPIVPRERDLVVVNVLRFHEAAGALVFCATRDGVTRLAANLNERGFSVVALSGELSQRERNMALQALRDGRARVCVATDVAARGLDLPDLGLVIHADLPQNKQMLVHRSGRTGRAGKHGIAIVLVPDNARRYVERTLQSAHVIATWMPAPSVDDILVRDQSQLVKEIGSMAEDVSDEDRQVAKALLAERPAEDMVASLVRARRQSRPSPEELTVPPSLRPGSAQRPQDRHNDRRPERPQDRHGNQRNDRPFRPHDERPLRGPAPTHGERPAPSHNARPAQAHAERPAPSHNARPSRSYGERATQGQDERPARAHDERPARTHDERPARAHDERPARAHDERPARTHDERPARPHAERTARPERTDHPTIVAPSDLPHTPGDHAAPVGRTSQDSAADRAVWFTINIGRSKNADPKWLIPLLCRRGQITKREIGKIQILARETRVEISSGVSERFAEAVRQPDPKDKNIHIEPLDAMTP